MAVMPAIIRVGGSKNHTDMTVCESALSATTQGNALLDTEIPDNESGSREDEDLVHLNAGDEQDVVVERSGASL